MNRAFAYPELFCGTSDGCVIFDNVCSEYDTPISFAYHFQRNSTPFKLYSTKFYVLCDRIMIADKFTIDFQGEKRYNLKGGVFLSDRGE